MLCFILLQHILIYHYLRTYYIIPVRRAIKFHFLFNFLWVKTKIVFCVDTKNSEIFKISPLVKASSVVLLLFRQEVSNLGGYFRWYASCFTETSKFILLFIYNFTKFIMKSNLSKFIVKYCTDYGGTDHSIRSHNRKFGKANTQYFCGAEDIFAD